MGFLGHGDETRQVQEETRGATPSDPTCPKDSSHDLAELLTGNFSCLNEGKIFGRREVPGANAFLATADGVRLRVAPSFPYSR